MGHKHGIGPQSLGASGMNPKSTPCGHPKITPLDFNASLRGELGKGTLNPGFEKAIKENDPVLNPQKKTEDDNSDSPVEFNVFENADPRAAANMMSDMAPTGGGNTMVNSQPGQAAFAPARGGRGMTASEIGPGGLGGFRGIGGLLKSRRPGGFLGRKRKLSRRVATGEPMTPAGPTVNTPGGGSGGAIAAAEAAQASADAANSQMDALKEKLSGIRSQLDSLSGMI